MNYISQKNLVDIKRITHLTNHQHAYNVIPIIIYDNNKANCGNNHSDGTESE